MFRFFILFIVITGWIGAEGAALAGDASADATATEAGEGSEGTSEAAGERMTSTASESQEPMDDKARATAASAAFALGNEAYNRGEYLEASAQYRKAYDLRPNWKLQYNIGQCEALLKRHGLALSAFERYLSEGGDDMSATRRDEVTAEVERLRTLVGYLDITAMDGAAVTIDGVYRGDAPLTGTIPVAVAIEHEVAVGALPPRVVVVHGGQTIAVIFDNSEVAEDPQHVATTEGAAESVGPEPSDVADGSSVESDDAATGTTDSDREQVKLAKLTTTGIVLMASGGATIVTGVITGSLALKKNNYLKDHCDLPDCDPQYEDDVTKRDHFVTATNVLIGAGIVFGAVGTALFLYARKKRKQEAPNVSAMVGTEWVGVSANWNF